MYHWVIISPYVSSLLHSFVFLLCSAFFSDTHVLFTALHFFCFFIRFLALHFPVTSLVNVHPILLYPQDFLMLTICYGIIIILITSQGKICVWTMD